jgi:hypothetical protein
MNSGLCLWPEDHVKQFPLTTQLLSEILDTSLLTAVKELNKNNHAFIRIINRTSITNPHAVGTKSLAFILPDSNNGQPLTSSPLRTKKFSTDSIFDDYTSTLLCVEHNSLGPAQPTLRPTE